MPERRPRRDSGSPHEIEIIVVDGGSGDTTVERAEEAGASRPADGGAAERASSGKEPGQATVRCLLFLHADTRLPRGWARRRLTTALEDPAVVGGAFRFPLRSLRLPGRCAWWRRGARWRVTLARASLRRSGAVRAKRHFGACWAGFRRPRSWKTWTSYTAMKRAGRLALLPAGCGDVFATASLARRSAHRGPPRGRGLRLGARGRPGAPRGMGTTMNTAETTPALRRSSPPSGGCVTTLRATPSTTGCGR